MKLVYPNTLSTFCGDKALALEVGYLEVSDEDYGDLVETKKKWFNGQLINDETYNERKIERDALEKKRTLMKEIETLKKTLASLDYHTLKHVDGEMSDEEYEPIKQQKIKLRARINEIEAQL